MNSDTAIRLPALSLRRYIARYAGFRAPELVEPVTHAGLPSSQAHLIIGLNKLPQGFSLMMSTSDAMAAERAFNTLAEGGSIAVPMQETFWAARFGVVTDRFGIPWSINCERAM